MDQISKIQPLTYNGLPSLRGEKAKNTLSAVHIAYRVFDQKCNDNLGRHLMFDRGGHKYLWPRVATIQPVERESVFDNVLCIPANNELTKAVTGTPWHFN